MSIVINHPDNAPEHYRVYTKGASEIVLDLCEQALAADGSFIPLSSTDKEKINSDIINSFADEGYRTLCLAYRDFYLSEVTPPIGTVLSEEESKSKFNQDLCESRMTMICITGIEDPVRPEVVSAIKKCSTAGICVRMVTGDNIRTATSIAKKCNILPKNDHIASNFIVLEGPDFRAKVLDNAGNLIQSEFDKIWPRLRVLARSSPKDKYTLVTGLLNSELYKLKRRGGLDGSADYNFVNNDREVVAVTGDGTNDAPALAKADIGFAMGIAGTGMITLK
jgi:Ca2+ transporting ATPase